MGAYPTESGERTEWILTRRGERNVLSPDRPYAFFCERERILAGEIVEASTIFLTNPECPWHCVMCDLWRNTTARGSAPQDIVKQIEFALERLPKSKYLKLYNSGSFFDPGAIPITSRARIAQLCSTFEKVIVECHPRLVKEDIVGFTKLLKGRLEIAMGLETIHTDALEKINKQITAEVYQNAVRLCKTNGIDVRTFLLVHPPFIPANERQHWLLESVGYAFETGSDIVSLIPTRAGNGALDALMEEGKFSEPNVSELERAFDSALKLKGGVVFADTWDLERFSSCAECLPIRRDRLARMNLNQTIEPLVVCGSCNIQAV
jgi:radical SAM enzyme (TIGR01210 family)